MHIYHLFFLCSFWLIVINSAEDNEHTCDHAVILPHGQNELKLVVYYQSFKNVMMDGLCANLSKLVKNVKITFVPSLFQNENIKIKLTNGEREQFCASKCEKTNLPVFACCRIYEEKSTEECAALAGGDAAQIIACVEERDPAMVTSLKDNGTESTADLAYKYPHDGMPILKFNDIFDTCTIVNLVNDDLRNKDLTKPGFMRIVCLMYSDTNLPRDMCCQ